MEINPRLRCNNLAVVLEAVRAGVGIALLPEFACERGWARVLEEFVPPPVDIALTYPSDKGKTARLRAFSEAVLAYISSSL